MAVTTTWVEDYVRDAIRDMDAKLRNDLRLPPSRADEFKCGGCGTPGANWFRTVMGDTVCTHCGWSARLQRALDAKWTLDSWTTEALEMELAKRPAGRLSAYRKRLEEHTIQELVAEIHKRLKSCP